jgi:hypothetical protein
MLAKALNAHHGRWENFWSAEQASAVHLVDAGARFDKLVYLLANPVADHLVDRGSDWPGASSLGMHVSGRTRTVPRPRGFFREDGPMPEEVTLRLEPLEGFEALPEDAWRKLLLDAVRAEEERARAERLASGLPVLGRKAVLRTETTASPKTVVPRRTLRPHLACRDVARRVHALRELLRFRLERAAALIRHLAGEVGVVFPYGTYRVRSSFLVAEPALG